jgi:hypothetical protein
MELSGEGLNTKTNLNAKGEKLRKNREKYLKKRGLLLTLFKVLN